MYNNINTCRYNILYTYYLYIILYFYTQVANISVLFFIIPRLISSPSPPPSSLFYAHKLYYTKTETVKIGFVRYNTSIQTVIIYCDSTYLFMTLLCRRHYAVLRRYLLHIHDACICIKNRSEK